MPEIRIPVEKSQKDSLIVKFMVYAKKCEIGGYFSYK
jgi:hypothetical protein